MEAERRECLSTGWIDGLGEAFFPPFFYCKPINHSLSSSFKLVPPSRSSPTVTVYGQI